METFWNIAMIFFMLSGFLGWALALVVLWYYWLCSPEQLKGSWNE